MKPWPESGRQSVLVSERGLVPGVVQFLPLKIVAVMRSLEGAGTARVRLSRARRVILRSIVGVLMGVGGVVKEWLW